MSTPIQFTIELQPTSSNRLAQTPHTTNLWTPQNLDSERHRQPVNNLPNPWAKQPPGVLHPCISSQSDIISAIFRSKCINCCGVVLHGTTPVLQSFLHRAEWSTGDTSQTVSRPSFPNLDHRGLALRHLCQATLHQRVRILTIHHPFRVLAKIIFHDRNSNIIILDCTSHLCPWVSKDKATHGWEMMHGKYDHIS